MFDNVKRSRCVKAAVLFAICSAFPVNDILTEMLSELICNNASAFFSVIIPLSTNRKTTAL